MANTLNLGTNGNWATKKDSLLAYNSENGNFKPLPFSFTRASSATVVNKDGLIETVGSGEPRIDYKDDSKGALKLEPSRSNLITYSEDFTQWSFKTGVGVSSNEIISVDGALNGSKIETTANGSRYVGNNYTLSTGDNTFSVFAKKGVNNWVYLNVIKDGTNNWNYTFDLQNGLIGQSNSSAYSTTAKIEDYGNGWYRCSITANVTTAGVFTARIYCADSSTDVSTIVGSNVYIYAAQLEQGSYATSYIPTQGSIGTRVAESSVQTPPDGIINSSEGVLYAEIKKDKGSQFSLVSLDKSSDSANYIYVGYLNNTTSLRAQIKIDSVTVLDEDINIGDTNVFSKVAVKYKSGDYAFFINGSKVGNTSTSTDSFSNEDLDRLEFGYSLNSSFKYYGNVREIKLYNTALTDQELINLTKI